jgi:hypothetical protein
MADDASQLFHLSHTVFLSRFNKTYPQTLPYLLVQPTSKMRSSVISALRRKTCSVESLLVEPTAPVPIGQNGAPSPINWASIPYSKPSKVKYPSFRSSSTEFDKENWQPKGIKSSLARLKSTYGLLHRRTSPWGPLTPA